MKKNEFAKLKSQSAAELAKTVAEARIKLVDLRRDIAANKTKNVRAAGALRRDIARMLTLMQNKPTK